jgi:quercetin dioxygenase-like cupin family protein
MLAQVSTPEQPRDGAFALMGSTVEPLVTEADTAGAWEAVRTTVGPGGRSPLHTTAEDKVLLVLAGDLVVVLGDDEHHLTAGSVVQVPAGAPHCYRNDGEGPGQLLVLTTGAGHVDFLRGMGRLTAGGPPEPQARAEHTAAHGVRLLPPR